MKNKSLEMSCYCELKTVFWVFQFLNSQCFSFKNTTWNKKTDGDMFANCVLASPLWWVKVDGWMWNLENKQFIPFRWPWRGIIQQEQRFTISNLTIDEMFLPNQHDLNLGVHVAKSFIAKCIVCLFRTLKGGGAPWTEQVSSLSIHISILATSNVSSCVCVFKDT